MPKLNELTWIRNIGFWIRIHRFLLVIFVLAMSLLGVWLYTQAQAQENQITDNVRLDNFGLPNLSIRIQYPRSLSTTNIGNQAKQIVIFPTGIVTFSSLITLTLDTPPGVINFVDKDRVQTIGKIPLEISASGIRPVKIWIEHAQTKQAENLKVAHVTTSIQDLARNNTPIVDLDFDILLETTFQRLFREFGNSTIGTLSTLVALIISVGGIIFNTYDRRRRISPIYQELQYSIRKKDWVQAIKLCDRIMDADPTYDSVEKLRENAREELLRQLKSLYEEAVDSLWRHEYRRAIILFEQILKLDENYEDTKRRLQETIALQERYLQAQASQEDIKIRELIAQLIVALADNDNWQSAAQTLIEIGQSAVEPLLANLGQEWPVWKRVVIILQSILGDELKILLKERLQKDDLTIRIHANKALEMLNDGTE